MNNNEITTFVYNFRQTYKFREAAKKIKDFQEFNKTKKKWNFIFVNLTEDLNERIRQHKHSHILNINNACAKSILDNENVINYDSFNDTINE
jgi:hypothetical protein